MKMYEVGGCVRDELLGVPSKDIDFTVVLEQSELDGRIDPAYKIMNHELEKRGFKIFLRTPEFLTTRAQFPKNSEHKGLTADFVLARKEGTYSDGRRPDKVEVGTLEDDLARRDFTVNAIAKDDKDCLIDPYNGVSDIERGVIRCVGSPMTRFREDALRAVRALRFSVTKGFTIFPTVEIAMENGAILDMVRTKISDERIEQELKKMFAHDTMASLRALHKYPLLADAMFAGKVNLAPTLKTKGRTN